ncbi:MAG: MBL fold metallo-hydrolase, partial [Xanthomonadales bacterium]|nr:MBL fold metallo-hydrolase [Xanthomonadales bacterium]
PGGLLAVDSGLFRPRLACCYLVEHGDEAIIVEAGGASGAERLLTTVDRRGVEREQVRFVIVTHVHLDHAGGAGMLMKALPNATLLVHPKGARHMVDPSKLEKGARAVYGDEGFDRVYGSLLPVPENRVREMADGEVIDWNGRGLTFVDTPGHASHHFCVHDALTNGWFTGDTFGLSYRDLDTDKGPFVFPTTTPIDFNPDALRRSIARLLAVEPEWMYMTHFGRIGDPESLAPALIAGINQFEQWGLEFEECDDRVALIEEAMTGWLMDGARQHGVTLAEDELHALFQMDIALNSAGIDVWLKRRAKARG